MEFPLNNAPAGEAAPGSDEFWAFNPQQPPPMAGAPGEETSLDDLLAYFQSPQEGAPGGDPFAAGQADAFPEFPAFDAAPAQPAAQPQADAFPAFDAPAADAFNFDAPQDAFSPFPAGPEAPSSDQLFDFGASVGGEAASFDFGAPAFGDDVGPVFPPLGEETAAFGVEAAPAFGGPAGLEAAPAFGGPAGLEAAPAPAFEQAAPAQPEEPQEFVWEDDLAGGPVFPPLDEAAAPAPAAMAMPAPVEEAPQEFVWEEELAGGPVFPPMEEAAPVAPAIPVAPPAAPAPVQAAPPAPQPVQAVPAAPAPPAAPAAMAPPPAMAAPAAPAAPPAMPQPAAPAAMAPPAAPAPMPAPPAPAQPVAQAPAPQPAPAPRPMPQATDPDATLRYRELPGEAQALNVPVETVSVGELTGKEVVIQTPEERRLANQELTQVVGSLSNGLDQLQGQMANLYAELQRAAVRRAPVEEIQQITAGLMAAKRAVGEDSELYQQALYLRQVADAYLRLLKEL